VIGPRDCHGGLRPRRSGMKQVSGDLSERKGIAVDENTGTTQAPNTCSVCGQSFDSEDELRSHEAEQHSEMGPAPGDTGGEQRGSAGPGDGMGREQGGGVAGG
jgi:hypothetical protein